MLAADFLQTILNDHMQRQVVQPAVIFQYCSHFVILQYVDDTLIGMQACSHQLSHLKELVDIFSRAFGLKVNYQKSNLIPINVPGNEIQSLAHIMNCHTGSFSFTYLGTPLGFVKPKM